MVILAGMTVVASGASLNVAMKLECLSRKRIKSFKSEREVVYPALKEEAIWADIGIRA